MIRYLKHIVRIIIVFALIMCWGISLGYANNIGSKNKTLNFYFENENYNVDLIKDNINGFIINDVSELWDKIINFKEHNVEYKRRYNQYIDINKYKVKNVLEDVIKNM